MAEHPELDRGPRCCSNCVFGFGAIQPAKHCGRLRKRYRLVSDAPVACEQAEQIGFFTGAAHCGARHPNRL